jgi:hypothetical protein
MNNTVDWAKIAPGAIALAKLRNVWRRSWANCGGPTRSRMNPTIEPAPRASRIGVGVQQLLGCNEIVPIFRRRSFQDMGWPESWPMLAPAKADPVFKEGIGPGLLGAVDET